MNKYKHKQMCARVTTKMIMMTISGHLASSISSIYNFVHHPNIYGEEALVIQLGVKGKSKGRVSVEGLTGCFIAHLCLMACL
jgi:hypothetical protein